MEFDFGTLAEKIMNTSYFSTDMSQRRQLAINIADTIFKKTNKKYADENNGKNIENKKHIYKIYVDYCYKRLIDAIDEYIVNYYNW